MIEEDKKEESTSKGFRKGSKRSEDFIKKVMKRLKRCVDADSHNRQAAIEDLKFLNGEQWDQAEKQRRGRKAARRWS